MSLLDNLGLEPEAGQPTPATPEPEVTAPEPAPTPEPEEESIVVPEGARNPDAVQTAIAAERKAAREANARARELQAELARIKEEGLPLEERVSQATKRAEEAEAKALRLEIGVAKGLSPTLAKLLPGTDAESIGTSAEEILAELKTRGVTPTPVLPGLDGGVKLPPAAPANPEQAHNAWLGEAIRRHRSGA